MPLSREIDLGPGDNVFYGDPAPPPPKRGVGQQPQHFSAHVYCGHTAEWIKMPLGLEVGLHPGHIVLDGDPAPPERGTAAPNFRPMSSGQAVAHLSNC